MGVLVLILCMLLAIMCACVFSLCYDVNTDTKMPVVKYDKFIQFYNLNPTRWKIPKDDYKNKAILVYQKKIDPNSRYPRIFSDQFEKEFRFGFWEYFFKYKSFIRDKNEKDNEQINEKIYNESYTVLAEEMLKEIESLKQQADEEVKTSANLCADISKNLRK